jgi:hypothetical protein
MSNAGRSLLAFAGVPSAVNTIRLFGAIPYNNSFVAWASCPCGARADVQFFLVHRLKSDFTNYAFSKNKDAKRQADIEISLLFGVVGPRLGYCPYISRLILRNSSHAARRAWSV